MKKIKKKKKEKGEIYETLHFQQLNTDKVKMPHTLSKYQLRVPQ